MKKQIQSFFRTLILFCFLANGILTYAQSHTFSTFNIGQLSSCADPCTGQTQTLSTAGLSGNYLFFTVEVDFVGTGNVANGAWSSTIQMEFFSNNPTQSSTSNPDVFFKLISSPDGEDNINSTKLRWSGTFAKPYIGGALKIHFKDDYHDNSGPYLCTINNVKITIYEDPTAGGGGGADNLGNHTATMALNMGSNRITSVADPTADQDAATKKYVDDQIAASTASISASLENSSLGSNALGMNTTGEQNSAVGTSSLSMNTSGDGNSAFGANSLLSNTTGSRNVAIGREALQNNTTGNNNVAVGNRAMLKNIDGGQNTALGNYSLQNNESGNYNTGIGYESLRSNADGSYNIGIGYRAMFNTDGGSYNASIGFGSLKDNVTGTNNTGIGRGADVTMDGLTNATAIGSNAKVAASMSMRFGNASVTNIEGQVNFTAVSDRKFKMNIEASTLGLDFIQQLRPVTYNMREHGDIQYTGFIAQEVDELVSKMGREWSGVKRPANKTDHFGLRYAEFTVPLVKATQEQQAIIDSQQSRIEELETKNDELENRLARIEKMLAQNASTISNNEITIQGNSKLATLEQNVPNPFASSTEIKTFIPNEVKVAKLMITTIDGKVLSEEIIRERGNINTTVNAEQLPAGNYIYTLLIDGKAIKSKTMVLAN